MGRRKKSIFKNPLEYIVIPEIGISDETKKGIFVVAILVLGAISLLGLFGLAGSFGEYLAKGQELALGIGKWVFPFLLFIWGFFLYKEDRTYFRGSGILGLILVLVSVEASMHLFLSPEEWEIAAKNGQGGGFVGLFLASMFFKILGFWGSVIAIFAIFIISLLLIFDTSLIKIIGGESIFAKIFYPFKMIFGRLFGKKDEDEEENNEADEEEDEEESEEEEEEEEEEDNNEEEIIFTKKDVDENLAKEEEEDDEEEKEELKKQENRWRANKIKIDLPLSLLTEVSGKAIGGDIKMNALVIQKTLENFGISVEMAETMVGPTVTQYSFKPAEGVKLSKITTLSNDLALSLAAHPIRIEAPIPGRSLVGIEVPNKTKAMVGMKEVLESKDFKTRKTNLTIVLGKDVAGHPWVYDITKMPHLLVAGTTNSGKSVCLNSIIISLLYQNNPQDLRFIMVDPKRVEFTVYDGIPHLLTPVITNVSKTINALRWCLNEMDRRFDVLSESKKRNIQSYNSALKNGQEKMPYIVFVVDELADLMVTAARDIESGIIRLAQMARAVGIHLVLATQRPSVDVITGLIKANMPARIAFSVASGVDSKTILDGLGAEKLLGKGDMLFLTAEISKPKRLQGAFVSDEEIKNIVNYIKEKSGEFEYMEGITDRQKVSGIAGVGLSGSSGDEDELLSEAKEVVINMDKASASLLQRKLSIGYARAARLLDELEEIGVIGPSNGAKPREILISREQYENSLSTPISSTNLHNREESEAPDNYLGEDESSQDEDEEDEEVDGEDKEDESAPAQGGQEEEKKDKEEPEEESEEDEKQPKKTKKDKKDNFNEDDGMFFSR